MRESGRNRSVAMLLTAGAIVAALVVIGVLTDGFGIFSWEMAPGSTTPPDNPG